MEVYKGRWEKNLVGLYGKTVPTFQLFYAMGQSLGLSGEDRAQGVSKGGAPITALVAAHQWAQRMWPTCAQRTCSEEP